MISDEVLDSIQILRFFHDKCNSEKSIGMMQVYRVDELAKAIESILNFIEKQSKEIERTNEILIWKQRHEEQLQKEVEELKDINKKLEARKYMLNAITGEVTAIPIDNNYISKDKIKAKIKELENEQESNREDLKIAIDNLLVQNIDKIANKISINISIRGILQSLLEKE